MQPGIFTGKNANKQYTIFKVIRVAGDSVIVKQSYYESGEESGTRALKLMGDSIYSSERIFNRSELRQLFEKGQIIRIER